MINRKNLVQVWISGYYEGVFEVLYRGADYVEVKIFGTVEKLSLKWQAIVVKPFEIVEA